MKKMIFAILIIGNGILFAQPVILPTPFLNAEPQRLCQSYLDNEYGDSVMWFTAPSGGALVQIPQESGNLCLHIFCDVGFHNLLIFSQFDSAGNLEPRGLKGYGLTPELEYYQISDSIAPTRLALNFDSQSGTYYFRQPVDVAVSSCGRAFKSNTDRIYVLDQGNCRVVKLRYDEALDSLIWESSFGKGILKFPTSIDYDDYGDSDPDNDDIYVTDAMIPGIIRFSKDGVKEAQFSGWGSSLANVGYPTGIAVSTSRDFPDRIYVTDSKNHRVVRYHSGTNGPIEAETQYNFSLANSTPLVSAVDTDPDGNVYVVNSYGHDIYILNADLSSVIEVYGGYGFDPGKFNYPSDIYIDGDEMQVCEQWGDSSGIQSFIIKPGMAKRSTENLPYRFSLHQNYPNPFNSQTIIMFDLPNDGSIDLAIYNILGQKVITLANQQMRTGSHSLVWNGHNSDGRPVSSGVYFARLKAGNEVAVKKLLLLK